MWQRIFTEQVLEEIQNSGDLQNARMLVLIVLQQNHTNIQAGVLDKAIQAVGRTKTVEELYNLIKGVTTQNG